MALLLAGAGSALAVAPATAAETSGTSATSSTAATMLVSASSTGVPGNRAADRPQISGNGRFVTFDTASTNIHPGITTWGLRVYRKDLVTGQLTVISADDAGTPTSEWSSLSWPDDSGNLVAFVSDAALDSGARSVGRNVFVRDVAAGDTELISVGVDGRAVNGASSRPMISRNGRYVAFSSFGSNLTSAGGNGQEQVYLRDRLAGTTTLISKAADGALGNNRSYRGMVSDNGRYVAWASSASNLVAGTQVNGESIFIRDLATGTTRRASIRPSDAKPMGGSRPYLSPDGRLVVFNSYSAIVPSDTNGLSDVYTYDQFANTVARESLSVSGGDGSDEALRGFVTDDGTHFVFNSFSGNLTEDDHNSYGDVFFRNRETGRNYLISRSTTGGGADGQSFRPVPDADGSVVTFLSAARNMVAGDTSEGYQVYATDTSALLGGVPVDDAAPVVAVTSPTPGQSLPGESLTITGTLADDTAVVSGWVRLRDDGTGLWRQTNGTWGTTAAKLPVDLAGPGAPSTDWTLALQLPAGSYRFEAGGTDRAGNESTGSGAVLFSMLGTPADTSAPITQTTSPEAGATLASPEVTFAGTAVDDRGVTAAWVQVRDNDTNLWLRADGTWERGARRVPVTLATPGGTTTAWSLAVPLRDGRYGYEMQARDAAGNLSAATWRTLTVSSRVPDTTAPTAAVTAPSAGQRLTSGAVTLTGTAADDTGVSSVWVQVRDNASGQWLRADGTWGDGARRIAALVAAPGSASTGWSLGVTLPDGSYGFDVQALDAAGNASVKPWTSFRVDTAVPDTTAPTVAVTAPAARAVVAGPSVTLRGTGTDDVGVTLAYVQVRDNASGLWLRPDGTWGAGARRIPATLAAPGSASSGWQHVVSLAPGSYGFDAQLVDAAGNASLKPFTSFTVS
ncbi:Ig-like domain-containing protein [Nocardioides nanhaiensis]|uniref:Bacterial Ig-like domain-containing protein n=1 Tax=Nocardioides nanhaiensis TaxID=1476871 RepID=A0ABP8VXR7_9ACTN